MFQTGKHLGKKELMKAEVCSAVILGKRIAFCPSITPRSNAHILHAKMGSVLTSNNGKFI